MILESISILQYKNLEQVDLSPSPKINYFLGKNAMGKTNLLDAIYFLSFCKSHANPIDSQNIMHGTDFALVQGKYLFEDNRQEDFICSLRRKQKKQFKKNKKEYERLSDHIGALPLVIISPTDTELINGGSDERRRFVDMILSQFDKPYLQSLLRYNKALAQRNALLKSSQKVEEALLDIWEEQLAQEGAIIYARRQKFITEFTPIFLSYYHRIGSPCENIAFKYSSHLHTNDLQKLLKQNRPKDTLLGYTSTGIHKDDLEMKLGDFPIKRIGSQGQNKTFAIALKFAQFELMKQMGHTTPILLLDDIFDKLDAIRVAQIIQIVSEEQFGQIFITDTNKEHLDGIIKKTNRIHHLYEVSEGQVRML